MTRPERMPQIAQITQKRKITKRTHSPGAPVQRSKLKVQSSGLPRLRVKMIFTKRTHSAKRIRCKPPRDEGHKDPCKLRDCSGMGLATGSAVIDRRSSLRDFTKRTHSGG